MLQMEYLFGKAKVETNPVETIEKITDRIAHSTLLEDRRSAVQALRGLARDWKLPVGTRGMPVLVSILQKDRLDIEIVKTTIETLNSLCTKSDKPDEADLGLMFTEIFVKDSANVTLLLDILGEGDFYVRFDTIQFLNTLLQSVGSRLQDCLLTSPMGISRLIDLLDDKREIIRNEGLLLLNVLSQSNADIQKIIAFENAFERVLGIMLEEGGTDGGIVVQDCLSLMQNLLRYNVSNQNLFRETSCIKMLPKLLITKSFRGKESVDVLLTDISTIWSEQKIANVNAVLSLMRVLLGPKNPNTTVNQTILGQASLVPCLCDLGFGEKVPVPIRHQAFECLSDLVRGHLANQDLLIKIKLNTPDNVLVAIVQMMLSRHDSSLRRGAYSLVSACYEARHESQLELIASMASSLEKTPKTLTPGYLLATAIMDLDEARRDPYHVVSASNVLMNIFLENAQARDTAASIKLKEGEDSVSLLNKCMFTLLYGQRDGLDVRVTVAILTLLAAWLFESSKAVMEFLTEGSNVQFLIEQVNQSSGVEPVIQGLAAYLLGMCYEFNDDSEPTFTRASIHSLVISRVGVDIILSRIERLRESKYFQVSVDKSESVVDPLFIEHFHSNAGPIIKSLTSGQPKKRAPTPSNHSPTRGQDPSIKIQAQEIEIKQLKGTIHSLESKLNNLEALENRVNDLEALVVTLNNTIEQQTAKYCELAKEQDDLFCCLGDQDWLTKGYKQRLLDLGETVPDSDEEVEIIRKANAELAASESQ